MKAKLNYTFYDPNIDATTEALLAVCMECCREKAEAAIHNEALECVPMQKAANETGKTA